jgi:hypothetical protein
MFHFSDKLIHINKYSLHLLLLSMLATVMHCGCHCNGENVAAQKQVYTGGTSFVICGWPGSMPDWNPPAIGI